MVDEQKLRELAEAATPGPWTAFVVGSTVSVDIGHELKGVNPCIVHWMGFESCELPKKAWKANARLIAAANPAATLALLDELQTLRSERTAWRVTAENAEAAVKQAREDAQPVQYPLHDDIQSVLFEVEQAIGNGVCPWQIEAAFEAYEAARRMQLPDHGIAASPKPKD